MPGIETHEHWQEWARGERSPNLDADIPKATEIPAMLRRRLNGLGKAVLSVAAPLSKLYPDMPTVFCSRHGDMDRTVKLLSDVSADEPLSPMHFSLSVHNAIAGVLSIATRTKSASTSLACNSGDISTALLEAGAISQEQRHSPVLCVIYDAPLPPPYPTEDFEPQAPYVLALVVTLPSNHQDSAEQALSDKTLNSPQHLQLQLCEKRQLSEKQQPLNADNSLPQALRLLEFLINHDDKLSLDADNHSWRWIKES